MMKGSFMKFSLLSVSAALLLLSTGCSSGGGGGGDTVLGSEDIGTIGGDGTYDVAAESVKLPEKFSIVLDASKVESLSPPRMRAPSRAAASFDDAGTDYSNTEANIWDGNFEDTLKFPNYLASLLAQSNASDFVGQGKYIALFDEIEKPFGETTMMYAPAKASTATTQSTSTAKEQAIFEVIQTNPTDPLTIKMWVDIESDWGYTQTIYSETLVTKNQSDAYPLGEFRIFYTTLWKDADGNVISGADESDKNALLVSADADNILIDYKNVWTWGDPTSDYSSVFEYRFKNRVAKDYTSGAFKQSYSGSWSWDGGTEQWSETYDVAYDNSVIAYKYPDWSSYWLGDDINYTTEYLDITKKKEIVYNYDLFNESDGSRKTLNTGMSITFTDSEGTHYGWASPWGTWIDGNISTGDTVVGDVSGTPTEFVVEVYRGTLYKRAITLGTMGDLNGTTCEVWAPAPNDEYQWYQYNASWDADIEAMTYDSYYDETYTEVIESGTLDFNGGYLWCGNQSYEVDYDTSITNATQTKTYTYENVTPDIAVDLNLTDYSGLNYTFSAAEFMLKDADGNPVDASTSEYVYVSSLTDSAGNEYDWSISNNDWDKSVVLKYADTNATFVFDKPLEFKYTHTLANDRNDDNSSVGDVLDLTYEGYGLWIPWESDANGNWGPQVSLKDGALLTENSGDKYVVKATDIGVEYETLSTTPTNPPSFLTIDLSNFDIDTGDFGYEDPGDISALEVKVINKVTQP